MYSLVDCNSFYCSCERVFNPKLNNQAVVVLSNNDGCAISRTDEAKVLGINMGTPGFELGDLIQKHGLKVFSSNYALYQDMSNRVMGTLASFVPKMEVYSIDEAFLDMTGFAYKDLFGFGKEIRETVLKHTGIPVGVGIAPTKTLAKMANRYAKKYCKESGVYVADTPEAIAEMMCKTEVEDIWGIGRERAQFLYYNNVTTAADLISVSEEWIRKNMNVTGQRLQKELCGIPCIEWEPDSKPKKGICTSRSFGTLLTNRAAIEQAVADYAANCAHKLRQQNSAATRLHIFIHTNPFRTQDYQYNASITMPITVATNESSKLIKYALHGLKIIFKPGCKYLKAGIIVDGLVPADSVQLGIFGNADSKKSKKMHQAFDSLNNEYGKGTVRFARQGFSKPYGMRQAHLSPRYTTRIEHVVKVK